MPVNPNARMVSPTGVMPVGKEEAAPEAPAAVGTKTEAPVSPLLKDPKADIKDEELLKDLDLEKFYLTSKLTYTFKMFGGKVPVTFKTLTSKELHDSNVFLFECTKVTDKSVNTVMLEHAAFILSLSMVKYGDADLSNKTQEERTAFIETVPGMLVPKLIAKYHLFEKSLDKALSDADAIKN